MDSHKIIQELIDPPKPDASNKAGEIEKIKAQRQIDISIWLQNKVTQEKIARINKAIEMNENLLRSKTFSMETNDHEIRVLTIRLTILKDTRDLITNID